MFSKLFKKNATEKQSTVGNTTVLIHDITSCQYGSVMLDGVRYCAKTDDGSELSKDTVVKVIEETNSSGTIILTVQKA